MNYNIFSATSLTGGFHFVLDEREIEDMKKARSFEQAWAINYALPPFFLMISSCTDFGTSS